MFEDVIGDIQDSIRRLHDEIEAKRKGFDALDANQIPDEHGEELAKTQDDKKRLLLGKCHRVFKLMTERL